MRTIQLRITLAVLFLASCSNSALTPISTVIYTLKPTNLPTLAPTSTPIPSATVTPSASATYTPKPTRTATPTPIELSPEYVGLPWDTQRVEGLPTVIYKPCYVNTDTHWHAGDAFMWKLRSGQIVQVVSPVAGTVIYATVKQNNNGNIIIQTPYALEGKTVFLQLRHSSTFDPQITKGKILEKGQHIGTLRWDGHADPGGYLILDMMLYRGDDWQADTCVEEGREMFFDTAPYHMDDLELIPYTQVPRCSGNPISQPQNFCK